MKKGLVKLSALALTCLMTISIATSCGTKSPSGTTTTNSTGSTSTGLTELKLPLVDQKTELSMVQSWDSSLTASGIQDLNEIKGLQAIEQKTNVHIKYITFSQNYEQSIALLVSSRDLPDIFERSWTGSGNLGGPAKSIDDGLIIPLNDLINQYAPNIKKYFASDPIAAKLCKTDDGKIFMFPQSNGPATNNVASGLEVRQDWLDKLSLKMPTTADEWYTVLKAFKTQDPNGNGKQDEIPYETYGGGSFFDALAQGMGVPQDFYQIDGKVHYGPLENDYKSYITLMAKWYKEGLIEQDFLTNDSKVFQANIGGNKAGSWNTYVSRIKAYGDMIKQGGVANARIVGAPYPVMKAGDKPLMNSESDSIAGLRGAGITPKCKDQKLATQWLDYLYSPEGQSLVLYGPEGDAWTKDSSGKVQLADKIMKDPTGLTIAQAMGRYGMVFAKFPMLRTADYMRLNSANDADSVAAVNAWTFENKRRIPNVTINVDDAGKFSTIMTDVNTTVMEYLDKFVMGQEPIENYDKFVQKLRDLRIDDAIKIEQAALDSFNKR